MTGQLAPEFPNIYEIWVYLSGSPLLALILTLGAYQIGVIVYGRANRHPLANPVLIAIVLVAATITLIGMPYPKYFEGAQFVHFLLGTATVSLAVPIYKGLSAMRGRIAPLLAALVAGGLTSIASAVGIARMLGADSTIVGGFVAKSVTAPIAMGIAERIGVSPTLTAVFAVSSAPSSRASCWMPCAAASGGSAASRSASRPTAWAPRARSASMRRPGLIRAWRWDCTACSGRC